MAAFNLTAQLNIVGPNNLKPVISNIRKQLSSVSGTVNIKIDPKVASSANGLNQGLQNLNATLKSISSSASSAAVAMGQFASAMNSINIKSVPRDMAAVTQQSQKLQAQQTKTASAVAAASNSMVEFGKQSALAIRRFAAFTLVTGIIFKFTNALSQASSEFMKFNRQLVQLSQVTGTSLQGLTGLEQTITGLSTSLGVSSSSLIDVSSTLAQAGLSAGETEQALKALALSTLAPSFGDLNETVEGSIALMRQFSLSTAQLEAALGSINSVAAKFAVEADDIIVAIQRTGGVFAAASKGVAEGSEALNQFIALFTSVRATTRESAETIATGLRTIFTRIQRSETIELLKKYGIQLTDLEGKFVGPYEAVKRLSMGLAGLDTRDIRFSAIIEELGGFRQVGKVIPLLQQFSTAEKALGVAQRGQTSLTADATKAQQALAIQMTKVQEEFIALVRSIGSSQQFQTMVKVALDLASALISIADASKHALPAIAGLLAVKGTMGAFRFASGFASGMRRGGGAAGLGERMSGAPRGYALGGQIRGYAGGTGPRGVEVALSPGEVVVGSRAGNPAELSRINRVADSPAALKRISPTRRSMGGDISVVPGTGHGDIVRTRLAEGGYVIKRRSVEALGGPENVADIIQGKQKFARGGVAQLAALSPGIGKSNIRSHIDDNPKIKERKSNLQSRDIVSSNIQRVIITEKDIGNLDTFKQSIQKRTSSITGKKGGSYFSNQGLAFENWIWDNIPKIKTQYRRAPTKTYPLDLIPRNPAATPPAEIKFTHDQVAAPFILNKRLRYELLKSVAPNNVQGFTKNIDKNAQVLPLTTVVYELAAGLKDRIFYGKKGPSKSTLANRQERRDQKSKKLKEIGFGKKAYRDEEPARPFFVGGKASRQEDYVQRLVIGGVSGKSRPKKEPFGTGSYAFPKRVQNAYLKQEQKRINDEKFNVSANMPFKDERVILDSAKVHEEYDKPFDREEFFKTYEHGVGRGSLHTNIARLAKHIGLPKENLDDIIPQHIDFTGANTSGLGAFRRRLYGGRKPEDRYDLTGHGFSKGDEQDLFGYDRLIEEKKKQIKKILKTPVRTYDDGSFSYDDKAYNAANDELREFQNARFKLSQRKNDAITQLIKEKEQIVDTTGKGFISLSEQPFGFGSSIKNKVLYHELTHQLLNSVRVKNPKAFEQYQQSVVGKMQDDSLADEFDAIPGMGYKSADVVYGRSYKLSGLVAQRLGNRSAPPLAPEDQKYLASGLAHDMTKARDYKSHDSKIESLLLSSGIEKDVIEAYKKAGNEEFLTTLVESSPKLSPKLGSSLDSTLSELFGAAGIKRQKFVYGGKVQRYVKAGEVEEIPAKPLFRLKDLSARIERLGGIGGVKELLGVSKGSRELDSRLRGLKGVTPEQRPEISQILKKAEAAKILRIKGTISENRKKRDEVSKSQQKGLLFAAVGLKGVKFPAIRKTIGKGILKKPVDVHITSGLLYEESAKKVEKTLSREYRRTNRKLAKEVLVAGIMKDFHAGKTMNLDFDRTLALGADKILSDPTKPEFSEFADETKVQEALSHKDTKLTKLGRALKKGVKQNPEFAKNLRVVTARPQHTMPLIQEWLQKQGLPITDLEGVGGPGKSMADISKAKAAKLKPGVFVDDDLRHITEADQIQGMKTHHYKLKKQKKDKKREGAERGFALERIIEALGGPVSLRTKRSIDFPHGLMGAAKHFGVLPNIPTDAKRTLSGPSVVESNIVNYLKAKGYASGGYVQKLALGKKVTDSGKPSRKVGFEQVPPSPFTQPKQPRFTEDQLGSIQKEFGLKPWQLSNALETARTFGVTDVNGLKEIVKKEEARRIQKQNIKSDPKALAAALQPTPIQHNMDLARSLMPDTRRYGGGEIPDQPDQFFNIGGKVQRFAKSGKVTDQTVYHGSGHDFTEKELDVTKSPGGLLGAGIYVGLNKTGLAAQYARKGMKYSGGSGGIYPVKIKGGISDFVEATEPISTNPKALKGIQRIFKQTKISSSGIDLKTASFNTILERIIGDLAERTEPKLRKRKGIKDPWSEALTIASQQVRGLMVANGIPGVKDIANRPSDLQMAAIYDPERIGGIGKPIRPRRSRLAIGGEIQKFADAGVVRRKRIIDSDKFRNIKDPEEAARVAEGMQLLGATTEADYGIKLSALAGQLRESGKVKKFRVMAGAAGNRKTSLAMGRGSNDNGKLRQVDRKFVLHPSDLDDVDEVMSLTTTLKKSKLDYMEKADRIYVKDSSTEAEQKLVSLFTKQRNTTKDATLFNREIGTTENLSPDYGEQTASLLSQFGSAHQRGSQKGKVVVLGEKTDDKGNPLYKTRIKKGDELPELISAKSMTSMAASPFTKGHAEAVVGTMLEKAREKYPKASYEDLLVQLAPDLPISGGSQGMEHGARYGIFPASFRRDLIKSVFPNIMVSSADRPSDSGMNPRIAEINKGASGRRRFAVAEHGAPVIISKAPHENPEGVMARYSEAGLSPINIARTSDTAGDSISGTAVRQAIIGKDYDKLDRAVLPQVSSALKANQPQIRNRSLMVPLVQQSIGNFVEANKNRVNEQINKILAGASGGPFTRMTPKFKEAHPDLVKQISQLRKNRDLFEKEAYGDHAHEIIRQISHSHPDIYGLDIKRRAPVEVTITENDIKQHIMDSSKLSTFFKSGLSFGSAKPATPTPIEEAIKKTVSDTPSPAKAKVKTPAVAPKGSGDLPTDSKTIMSSLGGLKIPDEPKYGMFAGKSVDIDTVKKVWRRSYPQMSEEKTASYSAVKELLRQRYDAKPMNIGGKVKKYRSGGSVQKFSGGGEGSSVPALVSAGEGWVPPDKVSSFGGYAALHRLNHADKRGVSSDHMPLHNIGVFSGPGTGTSDSIGPVGLESGGFVLRAGAMETLMASRGGKIRKFSKGGVPKSPVTANKAVNTPVQPQLLAKTQGVDTSSQNPQSQVQQVTAQTSRNISSMRSSLIKRSSKELIDRLSDAKVTEIYEDTLLRQRDGGHRETYVKDRLQIEQMRLNRGSDLPKAPAPPALPEASPRSIDSMRASLAKRGSADHLSDAKVREVYEDSLLRTREGGHRDSYIRDRLQIEQMRLNRGSDLPKAPAPPALPEALVPVGVGVKPSTASAPAGANLLGQQSVKSKSPLSAPSPSRPQTVVSETTTGLLDRLTPKQRRDAEAAFAEGRPYSINNNRIGIEQQPPDLTGINPKTGLPYGVEHKAAPPVPMSPQEKAAGWQSKKQVNQYSKYLNTIAIGPKPPIPSTVPRKHAMGGIIRRFNIGGESFINKGGVTHVLTPKEVQEMSSRVDILDTQISEYKKTIATLKSHDKKGFFGGIKNPYQQDIFDNQAGLYRLEKERERLISVYGPQLPKLRPAPSIRPIFSRPLPKMPIRKHMAGGKIQRFSEGQIAKPLTHIGVSSRKGVITAMYIGGGKRGAVQAHDMGDGTWAVKISGVSQKGTGPDLYDAVMREVSKRKRGTAGLTSDRNLVSGDANKIWEGYKDKRAVDSKYGSKVDRIPLDPKHYTTFRKDGHKDTSPLDDPKEYRYSLKSPTPDNVKIHRLGKKHDRAVQNAVMDAIHLKRRATGGEIPIMAQEGEFIINKHSAGQIGHSNLKKLNRGGRTAIESFDKLPKYHTGGSIQKFAGGGQADKTFLASVDYLASDIKGISGSLRRFGIGIAKAVRSFEPLKGAADKAMAGLAGVSSQGIRSNKNVRTTHVNYGGEAHPSLLGAEMIAATEGMTTSQRGTVRQAVGKAANVGAQKSPYYGRGRENTQTEVNKSARSAIHSLQAGLSPEEITTRASGPNPIIPNEAEAFSSYETNKVVDAETHLARRANTRKKQIKISKTKGTQPKQEGFVSRAISSVSSTLGGLFNRKKQSEDLADESTPTISTTTPVATAASVAASVPKPATSGAGSVATGTVASASPPATSGSSPIPPTEKAIRVGQRRSKNKNQQYVGVNDQELADLKGGASGNPQAMAKLNSVINRVTNEFGVTSKNLTPLKGAILGYAEALKNGVSVEQALLAAEKEMLTVIKKSADSKKASSDPKKAADGASKSARAEQRIKGIEGVETLFEEGPEEKVALKSKTGHSIEYNPGSSRGKAVKDAISLNKPEFSKINPVISRIVKDFNITSKNLNALGTPLAKYAKAILSGTETQTALRKAEMEMLAVVKGVAAKQGTAGAGTVKKVERRESQLQQVQSFHDSAKEKRAIGNKNRDPKATAASEASSYLIKQKREDQEVLDRVNATRVKKGKEKFTSFDQAASHYMSLNADDKAYSSEEQSKIKTTQDKLRTRQIRVDAAKEVLSNEDPIKKQERRDIRKAKTSSSMQASKIGSGGGILGILGGAGRGLFTGARRGAQIAQDVDNSVSGAIGLGKRKSSFSLSSMMGGAAGAATGLVGGAVSGVFGNEQVMRAKAGRYESASQKLKGVASGMAAGGGSSLATVAALERAFSPLVSTLAKVNGVMSSLYSGAAKAAQGLSGVGGGMSRYVDSIKNATGIMGKTGAFLSPVGTAFKKVGSVVDNGIGRLTGMRKIEEKTPDGGSRQVWRKADSKAVMQADKTAAAQAKRAALQKALGIETDSNGKVIKRKEMTASGKEVNRATGSGIQALRDAKESSSVNLSTLGPKGQQTVLSQRREASEVRGKIDSIVGGGGPPGGGPPVPPGGGGGGPPPGGGPPSKNPRAQQLRAAKSAAAPAAGSRGSRFGGGGGMGMYAAEMGISMLGSAAIENLAKGAGGDKTEGGRAISTIGGSAVSGASMGMMMGSALGPLGMVAGGVIGGGIGALYGQSQMPEIERQAASQKRMETIEKARGKMSSDLAISANASAPEKTRKEAEARAQESFNTIASNSKAEAIAGSKKLPRTWSQWATNTQATSAKTIEERVEAAQPAADSAKEMLMAKMQKTGKTLEELEASMPKSEFDQLAEQIAMTDKAYQALMGSVYADGVATDQETELLKQVRGAALARQGADVKAAGEAARAAKENAKVAQAAQKVTVAFEKMANALDAAAARANKVMENGKLGIEAIDNPLAANQQGQISKSADILSNPNAYSIQEVENAARQNSSMAGTSSEAMVQSAVLPRKLEESFGAAMTEARSGNKTDSEARASAKDAMGKTVEQAFGPEIAKGMKEKISSFVDKFEGDISQLDFNDLLKAVPELADKVAASGKVMEALRSQAQTAANAIAMMGDAAAKGAAKDQEARNLKADTFSTIANSTLAFKRGTGEKISWQADAGVRNQARAIRLGTTADVAASPAAMLNRYNSLKGATQQAANNQQQVNEANRAGMLGGDKNATAAMIQAANATTQFAQSTKQARDEIMALPNDIKENISGILNELQDVMQQRAAKIGAASGLMEKMLTSTPQGLKKMGNTFNNLNQTLAGKGVSFEESYSANTAYNQVRRQGGNHNQAQRAAQEAYAQETGDTLNMAKELAPLLGAVDPDAQSKMMGSVYESMFAARGMDTSKMMVGDKSMKDYIDMMKKGAKADPKVEALNKALEGQQAALKEAAAAANEVLMKEKQEIIAQTGKVIEDAMKAGAEAVRIAMEAAMKTGVTPPGEVNNQARKNEVENNNKAIEEAKKVIESDTATEEEKTKARRTKMEKEQENAVLSGSKTAEEAAEKHSGETKEQFNERKQKLLDREKQIAEEKAKIPPTAQNAPANAQAAQAATPAPATNAQPAASGAPAANPAAPVYGNPKPATGATAVENSSNQVAYRTTNPAPAQAAGNVAATSASAGQQQTGGTPPATTQAAGQVASAPTPQVNTTNTPVKNEPMTHEQLSDARFGKMSEDMKADSLSVEEKELQNLENNIDSTTGTKYADTKEDQAARQEGIQHQRYKISLLKTGDKDKAARAMFGLGEDEKLSEAQQGTADSAYKDATATFANRHAVKIAGEGAVKTDYGPATTEEPFVPGVSSEQPTESPITQAAATSASIPTPATEEPDPALDEWDSMVSAWQQQHQPPAQAAAASAAQPQPDTTAADIQAIKDVSPSFVADAAAGTTPEQLASAGLSTQHLASATSQARTEITQNPALAAELQAREAAANIAAQPKPPVVSPAQSYANLEAEQKASTAEADRAIASVGINGPPAPPAPAAAAAVQATPKPAISPESKKLLQKKNAKAAALARYKKDHEGKEDELSDEKDEDGKFLSHQQVIDNKQEEYNALQKDYDATPEGKAFKEARTLKQEEDERLSLTGRSDLDPAQKKRLQELKAKDFARNPEKEARYEAQKKTAERRALGEAMGSYKEAAETAGDEDSGQKDEEGNPLTNKQLYEKKQARYQQLKDEHKAEREAAKTAPAPTTATGGATAAAANGAAAPTGANGTQATQTQQRPGPMGLQNIHQEAAIRGMDIKEIQYERQQQYLSQFNPETRARKEKDLGKRLLKPSERQMEEAKAQREAGMAGQPSQPGTAPVNGQTPPSTAPQPSAAGQTVPQQAPASTTGSASYTPPTSTGAPVSAPRPLDQGGGQQNQSGGVLNTSGLEAFTGKLDTLLTKLGEVNIPTEIRLTSENLGVNVTLNGGEIMKNLPDTLKKSILREVAETIRDYDKKTTGEGQGDTPGIIGKQP